MRSFFTKHNKAVAAVMFFLLFAFLDGPFPEADSTVYLTWNRFIDPGYPFFLSLCGRIPGAAHFSFEGFSGVWYAVILQSLLWAYAATRFTNLVEELAQQGGHDKVRVRIAAWGALLLQFAVCLLNRFASARGAMYSNSVLTEALTMPLYTLFVCRLFYFMRDGGKRNTAGLVLCILLMIPVRTQMSITLLVWLFTAFVLCLLWKKPRNVKRFAVHVAAVIAVWTVSVLFTRTWNYTQFGKFTSPARRSEGILCMLLYTADETDAELFHESEQEQKEWFLEIAKEQKARGARYADAPLQDGWIKRYEYFMNRYDEIGFEIVHKVLNDVIGQTKGSDISHEESMLVLYGMEGELVSALSRQDKGNYMQVCLDNLMAGFVTSNARVSRSLVPVSVLFYAAYIALFVLRRVRKGTYDDVLLLSFIVFTGLVINAVMVAPFVFSQPRYDIYSMAMFYAMLLLMGV